MTANYASFWRRLGALIIDAIVLGIVQMPINLILNPNAEASPLTTTLGTIISLAIGILYWVVFQHKYGQTLGKKALNIKVVDAQGNPPTVINLFLREIVGKLISGLIFGIGYLWMLWDPKKQTLHDKIAGTFVVKI